MDWRNHRIRMMACVGRRGYSNAMKQHRLLPASYHILMTPETEREEQPLRVCFFGTYRQYVPTRLSLKACAATVCR